MLKVKNWVVEEKKHVRFYHEWNDKEVVTCVHACTCIELHPFVSCDAFLSVEFLFAD